MNSIPAARPPFRPLLRALAAGADARDRLCGVPDQVLRERSVVTPKRPASDSDAAKNKPKKTHR